MRQAKTVRGSAEHQKKWNWLLPLTVILVAALAQIATLQAFARFASEVASERASSLTDRRLFAQARIEAVRAVDLYPYNGYALFRLGASDFADDSANDRQRGERARASLEQARPYMPHSPNLLRLLGQTYYFLQEYDKAAATLDRFFRLVPSPRGAPDFLHHVRAMAHFRTGRQGEAVIPLITAATFPERRPTTIVPRILNALALDQIQSAEAILHAIRHESRGQLPNDRQWQELFTAAEVAGQFDRLTAVLAGAVESSASDPRLSKYLVGAYLRKGNTVAAGELLQQLRSQNPDDPDFPLMQGDIEYQSGNIAAAREHYREHLRMRPDSPARSDLEKKLAAP